MGVTHFDAVSVPGGIGSAYLDPSTIQVASVTLTSQQVKALAATPITLVAAPGAGKVLEFISAVVLLDYSTTAFAENGGGSNLQIRYTDGSGVVVSEEIEMTGFITLTADAMTTARAKADAIVAATGCENEALVLDNVGAGEITGNASNLSVLRVWVAYRTLATGW